MSREVKALLADFRDQLGDNLRPEDMIALEMLCRQIALLRRALAEAEAGTTVVKHATGVSSVNQSLRAALELAKVIDTNLARFGLSPLDRAKADKAGFAPRLPAPKSEKSAEQEEAEFEALLRSRPNTIPLKRDAG